MFYFIVPFLLSSDVMVANDRWLEQDKYWTGLDTSELPVAQVKETIAKRLAEISKE